MRKAIFTLLSAVALSASIFIQKPCIEVHANSYLENFFHNNSNELEGKWYFQKLDSKYSELNEGAEYFKIFLDGGYIEFCDDGTVVGLDGSVSNYRIVEDGILEIESNRDRSRCQYQLEDDTLTLYSTPFELVFVQ